MSPSIPWINRSHMDFWILFFVCITVVPSVSHSAMSPSSCPRDLDTQVHDCFTSYSFYSQSLNNSPQKLCCGVDVETLRAFCHSYTHAIRCVNGLKKACPSTQHHTIDRLLANLDGESKAGLMDLCKDDYVIESYAMYQACFEAVGRQSENCFSSHLKDSSTIRFLSKVNTKHKDSFCSNMRDTVRCVQRNVRLACGTGADDLAVLLVRPMVRDSYQCDYTIVNDENKRPKTTDGEGPAYISDDSRHNRDSTSGTSSAKNSNTNPRRHRNRNSSNANPPSMRGSNAGSHSSSKDGRGGALGIHSTGIHCSHVILGAMSLLFVMLLRNVMVGVNW